MILAEALARDEVAAILLPGDEARHGRKKCGHIS